MMSDFRWHDASKEKPQKARNYLCACKFSGGTYHLFVMKYVPKYKEFAYEGIYCPPVSYWMTIPDLPNMEDKP